MRQTPPMPPRSPGLPDKRATTTLRPVPSNSHGMQPSGNVLGAMREASWNVKPECFHPPQAKDRLTRAVATSSLDSPIDKSQRILTHGVPFARLCRDTELGVVSKSLADFTLCSSHGPSHDPWHRRYYRLSKVHVLYLSLRRGP